LCDGGGAVCAVGKFGSQRGWTALTLAAACSRTECARLLIDAGANIDIENIVRYRSLLCFGDASFYSSSPAHVKFHSFVSLSDLTGHGFINIRVHVSNALLVFLILSSILLFSAFLPLS
jgi:ankyrin repeat protein